ncbi:MAG TPA: excinuclease ABC subunit UvrC [Dehalococcoidia bacterium]|nr:excinuclease ABC subunit UvrC [Dehalococcoidia bacterium]
MADNRILELAKQLPDDPGVYLMKDTRGTILYIGKASNLRNRVRSYFSPGQKITGKTKRLVARVADIDFFITGSEQEALILELNLIKRHRPYYNIRLKDDKSFPYLKIDTGEDWPRVQITRRLEDNGGRYFGPFASAGSVRRALRVVKDIFPFRSCNKDLSTPLPRPCLEYDIKKCPGPCIGAVTRKEYDEMINQLILFLEGKQEAIVRQLKSKMRQAVAALEYERAAELRDQIQAIDEVIAWQKIATTVSGEQDVIAFAREADYACAQVFFIRGGRVIGREGFTLQGTHWEGDKQVMTSFVKQFYASATYIPPMILLQYPVEDKAVIEGWLQGKRGSRVRLQVPRRGNKKQLMDTVVENARQSLLQQRIRQLSAPKALDTAMEEIKRELKLPHLPIRMEGYDISNIQGKDAVGSMVVFEQGKPKPAHYRRFKIKTVPSADDYAMLQEVVRRRFGHIKKETIKANSWDIIPDLVLIDGGKGQLGSVVRAMHDIGADSVPVASLAKEREEIFIPQRSKPITLPYSSPGLQLLQRLRDEAHRFAVGYYRKVHKKQTFASALDAIPGVGQKLKHSLLKQFGSVQAIREASSDELSTARGISRSLGQKIKEYLN